MNILQIVGRFPISPLNFSSGVVNVVYHVSKELVKRGHNVTICSPAFAYDIGGGRKKPRFTNPVILDGIRVFYFPYSISFRYFYVMPKFASYVKKNINAFDVAHIHDIRCFQSIVLHHYARKPKLPYVAQIHGSYIETVRGNKPKWLLDRLFSRRILADATRVIALTRTESEYYERSGVARERIDNITNGIDFSKYQAAIKSGAFREEFGIGKDERIILYIGRITHSKGLDLLVEAFSDLANRLGRVKLVIVGPDRGYASALRNKVSRLNISDSTLFIGPVSESDKINAYADADVFVTPRFTGFPLTFLESCACGTPIVTTHDGDSIGWIDGYVGYVTGYSKKELTEAITTILCDDQTRERFKDNCKKLAQRFSWPSVVDKIEETYHRAAGY